MTTDKSLKDKAISIKGKSYIQVKDRILFLSSEFEGKYEIRTDYQYFPERKMWVVKATLGLDGREYTGLAQEVESDDYKQVNHTSALENCETSAVGRACAMAGIGVLDSIASADEINKASNRASSAPSADKPWYNDFKKHEQVLIQEIKDGATAQEILERIEAKFNVAKIIKEQILALGQEKIDYKDEPVPEDFGDR